MKNTNFFKILLFILTTLMPLLFVGVAFGQVDQTPENQIKEQNIVLPEVSPPVGRYVPFVRVGNLLYVSGHGPTELWRGKGKVGQGGLSVEEGYQAARDSGLRVLAAVRLALGSLNKVKRVVKTLGMVNSEPDFKDQPKVVNGCSDLMIEVFGQTKGVGARSSVGVSGLAFGNPVEVEMIFEVMD